MCCLFPLFYFHTDFHTVIGYDRKQQQNKQTNKQKTPPPTQKQNKTKQNKQKTKQNKATQNKTKPSNQVNKQTIKIYENDYLSNNMNINIDRLFILFFYYYSGGSGCPERWGKLSFCVICFRYIISILISILLLVTIGNNKTTNNKTNKQKLWEWLPLLIDRLFIYCILLSFRRLKKPQKLR